jgi:excisionase family DNA binding protein
MESVLSLREAAAKLGLSSRTVRRICAAGLLPLYRVSPRRVVIREADLESYLQSVRVNPSNESQLSTPSRYPTTISAFYASVRAAHSKGRRTKR